MGIALVAAMDRDRAIGRDNAMPWYLSDDFRHFKALTLGKPVLMGRLTAISIGMALPGRTNLVLSRRGEAPFPEQRTVRSVDEALRYAHGADLMVIGGGNVYAQLLPLAERLHLTEVDARIDHADTWFPVFDRATWRERAREHHPADARHEHAFDWVEYERIHG